jgi:GNAT superfamily N-acetyltransferase
MAAALRIVTDRDEALGLAPALDACAREFMAQFSDVPYPEGASRRFLEQHFEDPATVLVEARPEGDVGGLDGWAALCLVGPFRDPLLGTVIPLVLVLYVRSAWRHRGLGRSLLERAAGTLEERGVGGLTARVGHNDDALISMGERWGFVRNFELMQRD